MPGCSFCTKSLCFEHIKEPIGSCDEVSATCVDYDTYWRLTVILLILLLLFSLLIIGCLRDVPVVCLSLTLALSLSIFLSLSLPLPLPLTPPVPLSLPLSPPPSIVVHTHDAHTHTRVDMPPFNALKHDVAAIQHDAASSLRLSACVHVLCADVFRITFFGALGCSRCLSRYPPPHVIVCVLCVCARVRTWIMYTGFCAFVCCMASAS